MFVRWFLVNVRCETPDENDLLASNVLYCNGLVIMRQFATRTIRQVVVARDSRLTSDDVDLP